MTTALARPELSAGTWVIDTAHSAVTFSVRHFGLAAVRGGFREFSGQITVGEDVLAGSVRAEIAIPSIHTFNEARDGHLLSPDFFAAEEHPTAVFTSSAVSQVDAETFDVKGELTLKGVTKPVELTLTFNGTETDPQSGALKAGFSATTTILRSDFEVGPHYPLPSGKAAIADKVRIDLEIEAALAS
ncbi:YceI family protein [Yinghuangia seranimata]|uniref:YceI family protein n=1 Tax=Yinghuangia seranimata TaxID=408067 RepID=UPI00248B56C6|nr:YceI family protein [Yinghuangia seranimata]MDI2132340.1 YceI family protein [Yinghuangia seranimata]